MQGQTENLVLEIGEESKGTVEVGVAKPGYIMKPEISFASVAATVGEAIKVIGTVTLEQCAAAMLNQVVNGFEKETMVNDDLKRIGKSALSEVME